ncbi:YrdC domain-containing protein, mitochondrial [Sesamum alatum]|uniref:Threonylcarbamoyl-AMP synthase n=1 Tax=Sesamum alatum TaxID=300844 RepID=A0AAE2D0C6_9LAMI|nr:YrdC domain-containing protein, mitochondrial [Sesamum alatum]
MKTTMIPTKLAPPQTVPLLFTSHFQYSTGVGGLQSVNALRTRRDVGGLCAKRMAWSSEKYDGTTVETAKMGTVLPATVDYAGEAIEAVRAGKLIAVPTDTLYGFACDASSAEAVNRIFATKGRKQTNPLSICVGDVQDIQRFATIDNLPHGLLDSLLPGPVTLVLKRWEPCILAKSLNPGWDSIAIRVPDSDFVRAIARGSASALALSSANISKQRSSVEIKDFEVLWEHCAYIFNGGVLPCGRAGSTVVDLTKPGHYKIRRPGSAKEETVPILERYGLVEDSSAS